MTRFLCFFTFTLFVAGPLAATTVTVVEKANEIIIPKMSLREARVSETVDFLAHRSRTLDPEGLGVNILIKQTSPLAGVPAVQGIPGLPNADAPLPPPAGGEARVTLNAANVTLSEALKQVANLGSYQIRWDQYAVLLTEIPPKKEMKPGPRPEVKLMKDAEALQRSMSGVKLPKVDFRGATVREACEFVAQRHQALSPEQTKLKVVFKLEEEKPLPRITLTASNLPTLEIIRYIAEMADLDVTLEEFDVVLSTAKGK
jgi:hypothetical protein